MHLNTVGILYVSPPYSFSNSYILKKLNFQNKSFRKIIKWLLNIGFLNF